MIPVRLFLIFLITLSFGGVIAFGDTLKITGVLLDTDGKLANGYVVKLIVGTPRGIEASSATTEEGIFEITKPDVDPDTIELWQIICLPDGKTAQKKVKFRRQGEANIWTARVSLQLISLRRKRYSHTAAIAAISQYTAAQNLRAQSGEITETEANQLASMETAQILRHTELGDDPNKDLIQIYEDVLKTSDKSALALSVLNKDYFLGIRENPVYQNFNPEVERDSVDNIAAQIIETRIKDPDRTIYRGAYGAAYFSARIGRSFYLEGPKSTNNSFSSSYTFSSLIGNYSGGQELTSYNTRSISSPIDPRHFILHAYLGEIDQGIELPPLISTANPSWDANSAQYVFGTGSFTTKLDLIQNYEFTPSIKKLNSLFDIPSSLVKTSDTNFSYIGRPLVVQPKFVNIWNSSLCIIQQCAVTRDQRIIALKHDGTWFYLDK